ncbi:MAG: hypothetical protein RI959_1665 [Pseudomonadota bacterium]
MTLTAGPWLNRPLPGLQTPIEMTTILAFVFALGLLIAVHEYGHYRVAVACGVKVLRFSIGFGKPLLTWKGKSGTEFAIAMFPLGGYVRMLDEREAPVASSELSFAFNRQPVQARAAIVAAGPVANLLLAVLLYAVVSWVGERVPQPVVATPVAGSLAERAGLRGGDWVLQVAPAGNASGAPEDPVAVQSFDDLRWHLTQASLDEQDLVLWVANDPQAPARELLLPLSQLDTDTDDQRMFQQIGIVSPWSAPVLGELMETGAAFAAGLKQGDTVRRVNDQTISDAQQLRALIRQAVDSKGQGIPQQWQVERGGEILKINLTPKPETQNDALVGRVGAYIGASPAMVEVSEGFWGGWLRGVERTWDVSALSIRMMWKMLIGESSVKHLSGPLTIADYAGKSASMGLVSYLLFVALISVSLGVLNLLPLPVLDGGHLMYYLWEAATGRPVSDVWMERMQRGGVALLVALMSVALFNDLARLLG